MPFPDVDRLDNRDEGRLRRLLPLATLMAKYHRAEVTGLEHWPSGPALLVGNHNGAAYSPDSFLLLRAAYLRYGIERFPLILGHRFGLRVGPIREFTLPLGVIRGTRDNAQRALARGFSVMVYPGGATEAVRPFRRRHVIDFGKRTGFIRVALDAGVPVVPFVSHGAHSTFLVIHDFPALAERIGAPRWLGIRAWPLVFSIPWGLTFGPPPPYLPLPSKIRTTVLSPIHFERKGASAARDDAYVEACAARVQRSMASALAALG